jgi:nucleotide-binding universal stress UspA family protein
MTTAAFREVIVPLDLVAPCDTVLRVASTLADRAGVGVRLVTVSSPGLDHDYDEAELRTHAAKLDAAPVAIETLESNDVVPALMATAEPDGLITIETRARGPLAAIVLGSTANALLRATRRSVLLVGPATDASMEPKLMQVCLDTPDAAAALVPVACAWADQVGARLRFLHARIDGHDDGGHGEKLVEAAALRAVENFGVTAEHAVATGRTVAEAIVDDATASGAGLVCVGMRPRRTALRVALGSEAIAVAHATHAAVLAVPIPPGGEGHGDT